MSERNSRTWNALVGACIECRRNDEAIQTFYEMEQEGVRVTEVTLIVVLGACSSERELDFGKRIHRRASVQQNELGSSLLSALVNMYAKCGFLEAAKETFDEMEQDKRSAVSWNAMISAYIQNSRDAEALELYRQMRRVEEPDAFTFASILTACSNLCALGDGKSVHQLTIATTKEPDGVVGSALISMYAKCGELDSACLVFGRLLEAKQASMDVVCWNAMMSAFSQCGCSDEAFSLFQKMDLEGIKQVSASFVSILGACNCVDKGRRLELRLGSAGLDRNQEVGAALINMYSRCGSLRRARCVFDGILVISDEKSAACWTAMFAAYSHGGCAQECLDLLSLMSLEGIRPNEINFTSILNACSHAGLSSQAWSCFVDMHTKYGVAPAAQHLVCLGDMLGRAGMLGEAEEFIGTSAYDETETEFAAVAWKSLLNACKVQGNAGAGARIAEKLTELEPEVSVPYVLLSGLYAAQA